MTVGPVVPSLLARDIAETIAFYRDRLGFVLTGRTPDGDALEWCELTRDQARLQFYVEAPVGTPTEPVLSGTIYVAASDVRALHDSLGDFETAWGPEVMPYGMLELGVRDPNGYFIAFTQPV